MSWYLRILSIGFSLLIIQAAWAGGIFDGNCTAIISSGKSGLFIYDPSRAELVQVGQRAIPYSPQATIYYVPPGSDRIVAAGDELVWHIRTQTVAPNSPRANETIAWRPGGMSKCSPMLSSFTKNSMFVGLNRYIDHHADGSEQRRDIGLATYFHFPISDPRRPNECVQSDDPRAVGRLATLYGFGNVRHQRSALSRLFSQEEASSESLKFAGLSSMLFPVRGPANTCLTIDAPLPTRSTFKDSVFAGIWRYNTAWSQATSWKPKTTSVSIQRIPFGYKSTFTIFWDN